LTKTDLFNSKNKAELNAYKEEIMNSNLILENLSNSLTEKISNIKNKSLEHKINRFSENYYMSQNNHKK